jgi:hypothetical protein
MYLNVQHNILFSHNEGNEHKCEDLRTKNINRGKAMEMSVNTSRPRQEQGGDNEHKCEHLKGSKQKKTRNHFETKSTNMGKAMNMSMNTLRPRHK